MTSAKFTNECRSFCRISSILTSEVEDRLDETQITDQVYSQYNVGINIRLQLTESPERLYSVEGWHYGLQSLFQCHHPTLWTFMDGISKDIQKKKASFLQGIP